MARGAAAAVPLISQKKGIRESELLLFLFSLNECQPDTSGFPSPLQIAAGVTM